VVVWIRNRKILTAGFCCLGYTNGGVDRKQKGIDSWLFVVLTVQINRITVHWCSQQATVPRLFGHLISQQHETQANQIGEPVISSFILRFSSALEQKHLLLYRAAEATD
jgi:hypothetical protein